MNNVLDEIDEKQAANRKALAAARENAALYELLRKAPDEVLRLQKEGEELTAARSKAQADFDKAQDRKFAASRRNLRIDAIAPYVVRYDALIQTGRIDDEDYWEPREQQLHMLDGPMLNYVIKHKASEIPAAIRALAPDAEAAVHEYLADRARGYRRR